MPIRTLRLEIARPVDCSWDELGTLLRTQRRLMSQLLRAGMDARIACGVVGVKATKKVIAKSAAGTSPQTMVYQAMLRELETIQKSKWRPEARPALKLPGGMISALAQRVSQLYEKRAGFNGEQPIPVRKQETRVVEEDDAIVLDLKLTGEGRTRLFTRPSKGWHRDTLRRIASGEYKHGDCRIVLDEDRRKWYALLAYDSPAQERPVLDPARALVVHRGIHNALYVLSTTGQTRHESGSKLSAQLRNLAARMNDARRIGAGTLGDGARGHGKSRRYEHYNALDNKRSKVVRTWCQQMAAWLIKCALDMGCGSIYIETYGGIEPNADRNLRRILDRFPLHQLKESIVNAAQIAGLYVEEYAPEYISTTCPACGCQDDRQHNRHTGTFHCLQCELERPADFVATLNALRRSGANSGVWDERMQKVQRLRDAVADAAEE